MVILCACIYVCTVAADLPSVSPVLHKARIDNVKDYVEKKRLRLAEKQKEDKDDIHIQLTGDHCDEASSSADS